MRKGCKTEDFNYLESTIQNNWECGRHEIMKRIQAEWHSWWSMPVMLCTRRASMRLEGRSLDKTSNDYHPKPLFDTRIQVCMSISNWSQNMKQGCVGRPIRSRKTKTAGYFGKNIPREKTKGLPKRSTWMLLVWTWRLKVQ